MYDPFKTMSINVRQLMSDKRMEVVTLSAMSGVSICTIVSARNGTALSMRSADAIASGLGVTLWELLRPADMKSKEARDD